MNQRVTLLAVLLALSLAAPVGAAEPAATHEFRVTGMTCGLCAKAIEKSLRGIDGVRDVQIDRQTERVRVVANSGIAPEALEAAIESAGGYEADRWVAGATGPPE